MQIEVYRLAADLIRGLAGFLGCKPASKNALRLALRDYEAMAARGRRILRLHLPQKLSR